MQDNFQWTGRDDGQDPSYLRFHQLMNQAKQHNEAGYALIGFCSDEGVKRNHGRIGAAKAPDLIRKQLANLPVHHYVAVQDMGNVYCADSELEQAQARLADQVAHSLAQGHRPIVLGGGHEVAFGSFSGIFQYMQQQHPQQRIGIINFDAHFDLRQHDVATSGTPFLQAANLSQAHGKDFHYMCLGVARHANTRHLFETADQLNCHYVFDYEIHAASLNKVTQHLDQFIAQVDVLYVTVDLDVFSASIAPGVSAPAVRGIDVACFDTLFQHIKHTDKIRVLDIAECNPIYDIDQHTAKLAAYIAYNYMF
ncbi:formiminoglutamase [Acinetobacter calcoaceticus]|uniref:Formimidoylglutamase n=1 Tax=Acinetobacter calcoaceticus TaxID=471 RepID=A0A4V2QZL0_ACICA|nr:formiminoglutamase [Acinetobacter calcoaceticus]